MLLKYDAFVELSVLLLINMSPHIVC